VTIGVVSAPFRRCAHTRGHITAESEIYDRARRPDKRHPVIVFISMLVEPRVDSPEEGGEAGVPDLTEDVAR